MTLRHFKLLEKRQNFALNSLGSKFTPCTTLESMLKPWEW
jgi:hypothetical protein